MTVIEQDYGTGEEVEGEVVDVSGDMNALAVLNKSEIDVQVSTAKKFPRSIGLAKRRMVEMATLDEETAKACGYALKRKDKGGKIVWIEGPSIRMAEIAVSCWGNLRYGARVIEETDRFIVAQGVCYDLEANVFNTIEVRRRITDRNGRKYGDDMVGVTANAACAIAQRNAVFKVVPRAIINAAYAAAMAAACGDAKTFTQRRQNAVGEFKKLGVTTEELLAVLGKPTGGPEDIDTTDLRRLHGLLTAINDGETTVDAVFRPQAAEANGNAGADQLNERLKAAAAAKVSSKPVSENQKFEPSEDAIAEKSREMAANGEVPPDVSGHDDGRPEGVAPNVSTWRDTLDRLNEAAQDAGLSPTDLNARVGLWLMHRKLKGKADDVITEKTSPADRLALVGAVRTSRLGADGKIQAEAPAGTGA